MTRDLDLLSELVKHHAVTVWLSITTLDPELRRLMEPRTSPPAARLAILQAAADAGATSAGYTIVRLPHAVAPLFEQWLETHFPGRKEKVLNRLKAMRGGKLYNAQWGKRFSGEGVFAEQIAQMFEVARRKAGIQNANDELSAAAFRRPLDAQLQLFS